jgi:5-methylcytosine-specific restriction enzyme A
MPSRPPSWSRQELILALELYFDVGAADYRSSRRVQELSRLIRAMHGDQPYLDDPRFRSASSVSRKLKNIAWIDPRNTRGTAQSHGSAVDEEIWDEFADDRERLAGEAAVI